MADSDPPRDVAMRTVWRDGFLSAGWTVSPSLNVICREGETVRLEPRVMDVLVTLAAAEGAVVSKDALMGRVWPDRHVTDDVLTVAIYALRKALGDNARRPRYVETVSRRGYRWIAPVVALRPDAEADQPSEKARDPRAPQFLWLALAAGLLVAVLLAGAWQTGAGASTTRYMPRAESREASIKGRDFLDQRSIQGWRHALDHYRHAVALDPRDPVAHAGLADAYSAMWDFGIASRDELRPQALEAARRALALDSQAPEGLAALGRIRFLFDWDFPAAERALTRATALDPDYMPAHQALAWVHSARGRHDQAIRAARRALQIDPVNTARYTELAWVLALAGRHDEALQQVDRAIQVDPRAFAVYLMKGWTSELTGHFDAAFAAYAEGLRVNGVSEDSLSRLAAVYRAEGMPGYYRRLLNRKAGDTPMSNAWRAQVLARIGQIEGALDSLQSAFDQREGSLAWIAVDPGFAPLRGSARFQQIAAQVHRKR